MRNFTVCLTIAISIFGFFFLLGSTGSYELELIELKEYFARIIISFSCILFPFLIAKIEQLLED